MTAPEFSQAAYARLLSAWTMRQDNDAWAEISRRLLPLVRKMLVKRGIHYNDVDDVAADVLFKVMDRVHLYDSSKTRFTTWVCNIARNHAIDLSKKRHAPVFEIEIITQLLDRRPPTVGTAITPDEAQTMNGYLPFRTTPELLAEIGGLFFAHGGKCTADTYTEAEEIFTRHRTAWQKHGELSDVVHYFFALIRLAKMTDDDWNRTRDALVEYIDCTPLRLLKTLLGPTAAAAVLLLFGGNALELPPANVFTALSQPRRRKRKHQ